MVFVNGEEVKLMGDQSIWVHYSKYSSGDFVAPYGANLEWVLQWYKLRGMIDPAFTVPKAALALLPGLLNLTTREYYRVDSPYFEERDEFKIGREMSIEILKSAGIGFGPGRRRDVATRQLIRGPEYWIIAYWDEPGFIALKSVTRENGNKFAQSIGII